MTRRLRTLVIDDSAADRELVKRELAGAGDAYDVVEARSRPELDAALAREQFDLVISDYNILGFTGMEVLAEVKGRQPETPVILLTGTGSEEIAVAAMKQGAADYVIKSVTHIKKLPATAAAVLDRAALERERRALARHLRLSEEKYRSLVEAAPEAILSVGGDGGITFFSRGAENIFGYAAAEVVGTPLARLAPSLAAALPPHDAGGPRFMDATVVRPDGSPRQVELSVARTASNPDAGVTLVVRDVTENRRMAAEIARLDRLAAVGEMTAAIAHEVRNPLAGIAASAGVIREELARAGGDTDTADWILEGVQRIEFLLRRFFDFARPLELEREPCDLNDLVRRCVATEADAWAAAGIAGRINLAPALPVLVLDPALVQSVLANVLRNAREAMAATAAARAITVTSGRGGNDGEVVTVRVADTGPGVPADVLPRLTEPFFTTKAAGVGLGLALCLKIMKAHGGDFIIANGDVGAEVRLVFPAREE
jgi:two-component system NtrC family sensor kinase